MIYRTVKPSDGKYILSPVDPETTESPLIFVEPIPEGSETAEEILIDKYGCKDLEDLKQCFLNNTESLSMILEAMEEYKSIPEITEGIDILKRLVELKDYKDRYSKDESYLKEQPILWEKAKAIIKLLER